MARPLRLERPGAVYFIATSGNAGLNIFREPTDSERFLDVVAEACRRFQWRCLAYCLLPESYQLVVRTEAATLSRGMRQINGRYTQAFHRRQGRYRAVLVEPGAFVASVCCDVLRQPVQRGLAAEAAAWRWSSYRATLGRHQDGGVSPDWLDAGALLDHFGSDPEAARHRLAAAIDQVPKAPVWEDLRHQVFLGSDAFVEAMREEAKEAAAARGNLAEIPRAQWQTPPPPLENYEEQATTRDEAMAKAYLSGRYSQAAIAAYFKVHYSSVSRAVRRYEQSLATAP